MKPLDNGFLVYKQKVDQYSKDKDKMEAVLITWIGESSTISIQEANKLTSQFAFQETYAPFCCNIFVSNIQRLQKTLDELLNNNSNHPSFKNTLEPLPNGFLVYTSKERRPIPKIITMVSQKSQVRHLLQMSPMTVTSIPDFTRPSPQQNQVSLSRVNQQLIRQNPKISQEVVKLQENLLNIQKNEKNPFKDELSDTLEDGEINLIQSLISSMNSKDRSLSHPQQQLYLTELEQTPPKIVQQKREIPQFESQSIPKQLNKGRSSVTEKLHSSEKLPKDSSKSDVQETKKEQKPVQRQQAKPEPKIQPQLSERDDAVSEDAVLMAIKHPLTKFEAPPKPEPKENKQNIIQNEKPHEEAKPQVAKVVEKQLKKGESSTDTKAEEQKVAPQEQQEQDNEEPKTVEQQRPQLQQQGKTDVLPKVQKKIKQLTTLISNGTVRFAEQKIIQAQNNLVDASNILADTQTIEAQKDVKSKLNKVAMAFLIIESGKHACMKKDFNQTLLAVKQFLPPNADGTLKRLIQGANQDISMDEVVAQIELWVTFCNKFFGV